MQHLRSGGVLLGARLVLSTNSLSASGIWLCGTESQVNSVLEGQVPIAMPSLLDASERLLYEVELSSGSTRAMIADLEGDIGNLPFKLRQAICVDFFNDSNQSQSTIGAEKTLPLPAQLEEALVKEIETYSKRIQFKADGSFTMG